MAHTAHRTRWPFNNTKYHFVLMSKAAKRGKTEPDPEFKVERVEPLVYTDRPGELGETFPSELFHKRPHQRYGPSVDGPEEVGDEADESRSFAKKLRSAECKRRAAEKKCKKLEGYLQKSREATLKWRTKATAFKSSGTTSGREGGSLPASYHTSVPPGMMAPMPYPLQTQHYSRQYS